jgi:hypothetical protein
MLAAMQLTVVCLLVCSLVNVTLSIVLCRYKVWSLESRKNRARGKILGSKRDERWREIT